MKYLAALLLLSVIENAVATECRVNGGPWMSGTWVPLEVPLIPNPSTGRIDLDGFRLECRYEPDGGSVSRKDFLHTLGDALYAPGLGNYRIGARIGGRDYPNPIGARIPIATLPNNGLGVDLDTYLYILTQGAPGTPINIRAGDEFAQLRLRQTTNWVALDKNLTLYFVAKNSLVVEPSTCTINGNNPIDVNFNQVDPTRIGESVSGTPIRANIRLNYSCPDPGINMPITITFKGIPASFDSGVISMSNTNLGTGLLRAGTQIRPESSFRTNIYNSSGGDDVIFALTRKPGSVPATGPFTGSATLVMGVP